MTASPISFSTSDTIRSLRSTYTHAANNPTSIEFYHPNDTPGTPYDDDAKLCELSSDSQPLTLRVKTKTTNTLLHVDVKTLTGEVFTLWLEPHDTTEFVKKCIYKHKGIGIEEQRIIYCGRQLDDGRQLVDYRVQNKTALHLVPRIRGC